MFYQGYALNALRTGFNMLFHVIACFNIPLGSYYMFLHFLGSLYMCLHVLSKKVVAQFLGYFSNMIESSEVTG